MSTTGIKKFNFIGEKTKKILEKQKDEILFKGFSSFLTGLKSNKKLKDIFKKKEVS